MLNSTSDSTHQDTSSSSRVRSAKKEHERDLGRHYLSYPEVNKPKRFSVYYGDCDIEFDYAHIIVRVALELAPEGAEEV